MRRDIRRYIQKPRPFSYITGSSWYRELQDKLQSDKGTRSKEPRMINVGSFTVMLPPPCINLDILDLSDYAEKKGFYFKQVDVTQGLPYEACSVEFINCSHLIEHLTIEEAKFFLKECYRVLVPKGKIRIGVPDLQKLIDAYLNKEMDKFDSHQPEEYKNAPSQADKFWRMLTSHHKTCYDYEALVSLLQEVGFKVEKVEYDERYDMYPDHSLYVEGEVLKDGR